MGLQQELGRQVRRHRERMGLSQVDLAEAIGRSVQMISRIERGVSAPSFDTLEEISRVLQTPPKDFFGPPDLGSAQTAVDRVVHRLADLSAEEIDWVEGLIAQALQRPERKKAKV